MKTARDRFGRVVNIMGSIRDHFLSFGVTLFAGLGFMLGWFAMIFIIADAGQEVPRFMFWMMNGFAHWISITIFLSIVHMILLAVLHNKRNWEVKKHGRKSTKH